MIARLIRLCCCLLLLCTYTSDAQQQADIFHLDLYKGLPSNLIYGIFTDNFGYLWICTDNGLVRYNGYDIKKYTTEDGLPSNDVWGLYRDHKDRMWLCCVCSRVGYISNGRYKDAYVVQSPGNFYLSSFADYQHGIRFINAASKAPEGDVRVLFSEKNDTIRASGYYEGPQLLLHDNLFAYKEGKLTLFNLDEQGKGHPGNSCTYEENTGRQYTGTCAVGKTIVRYIRYTNRINIFDFRNCTYRDIFLTDEHNRPEPLTMLLANSYPLVAITKNYVMQLDSSLNILDRYPLHQLIGDTATTNGNRLSGFINETFWKKCVATQNSGLYINYESVQQLNNTLQADLSDYKWLGNTASDTASYWWSYKNRTLLTITATGSIKKTVYSNIYDAVKIIPYTAQTALTGEKNNLYTYNYAGSKMDLTAQWYRFGNKGVWGTWKQKGGIYIRDLAVADTGHIYIAGTGLMDCTIQHDSISVNIIEPSKYYHLYHDTIRNCYWAYYNDRLLFYDPRSGKSITAGPLLTILGIPVVEQIAVCPVTGHLLIKDHTRLLLIDIIRGRMTSLFTNYNLKETIFLLKHNRIILAGKFGIITSTINDAIAGKPPVVFPNIRNARYFRALDMAVMKNSLLLKTDKSTFIVPLQDTTHPAAAAAAQHKIIADYNDTLHSLPLDKHLNIVSGKDKILLDVISPAGNGPLTFKYRITEKDEDWHELNNNELKLPDLAPDRFYHLHILAADEVWKSDETELLLYTVPQWWQTPGWVTVITIGLLVLVLLVLLGVILLTRYYVRKAANRRQFMNTLELRAIHAQINPHFIFNTLNTALYFIQKEQTDEAATHVSRFSRLLRGYLDASHTRYTSIAEEAASIRNYIELQQARFEDSFTYEILIADDLPADSIQIPSLLLQPIVENAINHGLSPRSSGGLLHILFLRDESGAGITCIVDDNGIGRKQAAAYAQANEFRRSSHGSRLTRQLVDVFNRYEKTGITISYTDKEPPETGTRVTITIKNPRYEK